MAGPAMYIGGLNIAKNEDWIVGFQLKESSGTPVDLTGYTFRMMIRKHETDHEALVVLETPDNGIEIQEPAYYGKFLIWITRDKLARLYPGEYVSDMLYTRPDGVVQRMWDASPVMVYEGTTR
jgi:hypothetical protein